MTAPLTVVSDVLSAGTWDKASDWVALTYDARLLRRRRLQCASGHSVLVDFAAVTNLNHGDALVLEDGRLVEIRAAAENLHAVTGPDMVRLAWHIGNRHTPCQIQHHRLLILHDHVLAKMLRHLGAEVSDVCEPFTPEGGAYGHGRTFGHSHGPADTAGEIQNQDHDHDDGHNHDHSHDHSHAGGHKS